MSDDERELDGGPSASSRSGLLADVFAPGVLVRLQYAMFLFAGLVICLILKGSASHAFESFSMLRRGCEFLQDDLPSGFKSELSTLTRGLQPPPLDNAAATTTMGGGGGGSSSNGGPPNRGATSMLSLACFENTLVYRVSFSLALFFLFHLISVSDLTCCIPAAVRAQMQERFFGFKTTCLILLNVFTFAVVPNSFFSSYAWLCMGVSAIFLIMQVILLVDFSYQWNDEWSQRAEGNAKWQWYLVAVAAGCYLTGIVFCILCYVYFVPHSDCNFNAFATTAVLCVPGLIGTLVAVWVPHGSIVPSGIVFAYCAIMEFVTLRSERDSYCNALPGAGEPTSFRSLLLSSLFSGIVLAYTVVSSSGSRTAMSLEADEDAVQRDADQDGHLSGYLFFHSVMLMGSMYMAMLVSDWEISGSDEQGAPTGFGATSVSHGVAVAFWVKHASLWLTMFAYLWTLLAPYYCCKDRDFGINADDW